VAVELAPPGVSPARRLGDALMRAETEAVCLLDAGLRPLDDEWLGELLGRLADPATGLAAPVVTDREGFVLEAGLRLSLGRAPEPRGRGSGPQDPGPGDVLRVAHQVAAVRADAFATRRADFTALGGFDPVLFPGRFGAADYALKLQALGRHVVVSPDARLWREGAEGAPSPARREAEAREAARLEARWLHAVAADPFGNPLVAGGGEALRWPPGDPSARSGAMRPPRPVPPGW
uniref:glycosyltransferase family 2 protein n=1 Tax=Aureimonas sp. AU4 TaxID=1638163 RepID=UPI000B29ECAC